MVRLVVCCRAHVGCVQWIPEAYFKSAEGQTSDGERGYANP
jgi:hypothetical protein